MVYDCDPSVVLLFKFGRDSECMHAEMLALVFILTYLQLVGTTDTRVAVDSVADSLESKLCQPDFSSYIMCTDQGVLLTFGNCAIETNGEIYVSSCHYFQLDGHNVTEPGYIILPDNISELNDYMCGPMNRKGYLCKDCIDGFGPSVASLGYKCSNCTDVWYGIPLYLAVELIPITLFYLIILIFKVQLTSAPIVLYIFYSQMMMFEISFERDEPMEKFVSENEGSPLLSCVLFFYGIWNLEIFSVTFCHHFVSAPSFNTFI